MDQFVLDAAVRPGGNKGAARKVRKAGDTPGVVYRAGGESTPIRFDGAALAAIFRKSSNPNALIALQLDGGSRTCIVREIQRHPVNRRVEHVDFYEIAQGDEVTVTVAVKPVGRAAGTRAGGQLRLLAREVRVKCSPFAIPPSIDVDVTPLEVGQFVKASQVKAPEGATLLYKQDFNLVTVDGKRVAKEEAAAAPEAAKA